jgi:hypothetical protein
VPYFTKQKLSLNTLKIAAKKLFVTWQSASLGQKTPSVAISISSID